MLERLRDPRSLNYAAQPGSVSAETAVGVESALTFSDPDELLATFKAEIARWNNENRDS